MSSIADLVQSLREVAGMNSTMIESLAIIKDWPGHNWATQNILKIRNWQQRLRDIQREIEHLSDELD